jgi:hypothetical protein
MYYFKITSVNIIFILLIIMKYSSKYHPFYWDRYSFVSSLDCLAFDHFMYTKLKYCYIAKTLYYIALNKLYFVTELSVFFSDSFHPFCVRNYKKKEFHASVDVQVVPKNYCDWTHGSRTYTNLATLATPEHTCIPNWFSVQNATI